MRRSYVWVDGRGFVEYDPKAPRKRGLTIISDIAEPFESPVDGTVISSKADRREHNIRNECEDVGNDPAFQQPVNRLPKRDPITPDLLDAYREHGVSVS